MTSAQSIPAMSPAPMEAFVDPDTAARYLHTTRRQLLEMVRAGRHTWCENSASMAPSLAAIVPTPFLNIPFTGHVSATLARSLADLPPVSVHG